MKLSYILENITRRGFLKTVGSTLVMLSAGDVSKLLSSPYGGSRAIEQFAKLFSALDVKSQGNVRDLVFQAVNTRATWGRMPNLDGTMMVTMNGKPVEATKAALAAMNAASLVAHGDAYHAALMLTGEEPWLINDFIPGMFENMLDYSVRRYGTKEILKAIQEIHDDLGDIDTVVIKAALRNQELQKVTGMSPDDVDILSSKELYRRGLASKEQYVNRDSYERSQKPKKKPKEKLEKYKYPKDYELSGSMHQPFESRLKAILGII